MEHLIVLLLVNSCEAHVVSKRQIASRVGSKFFVCGKFSTTVWLGVAELKHLVRQLNEN